MADYVLFFLSMTLSIVVVYKIKNKFFKKIIFIYYSAWHIPLIIGLFFPFESPMKFNPVVTAAILFLVHFVALPSVIYNRRKLCNKNITEDFMRLYQFSYFSNNRKLLINISIILAYLAICFVFIDLYVLRGLSFLSGSIDINRSLYMTTSPTFFGYLGLIGSALSLFLLTTSYDPRVKSIKITRVIPFLAIVILYLLSGNRQFLLFGLLLLVMQYSFYSTVDFKKYMTKLFVGTLVFLCLMLTFQFIRQTGTKGKQFEFIQSIAKLECTNDFIINNPLIAAPLAYLYVYYGMEYQATSLLFSVDNADIGVPVMSMTAPLLYRRIYPLFGLDDPDVINKRMQDYLEQHTGMIPTFWITMYSPFYLESGVCGLISVVLLAAIFNAYITRRCLTNYNQYSYIQIVTFYSSMVYGIMSPATSEPIFIIFITFIGMFKIYLPSTSNFLSKQRLANIVL